MRRKTQWAAMSVPGAATVPVWETLVVGTPEFLTVGTVIGGADGFVEEEVTVTRMIGHVAAQIGAGVSASNGATVTFGIGVFTTEAVAAGIASIPDPSVRPDFEWLYWKQLSPIQTGGADPSEIGVFESEFDVRGQRVVRSGQTLVTVVVTAVSVVRAFASARVLVKLT